MHNQDQLIQFTHGEKIVCGIHGKFAFHFRCGPVAKACWICCCQSSYRKGHQGKVNKAWRDYRPRRTAGTLKAMLKQKEDGWPPRKGLRYYQRMVPKWWDDLPAGSAIKNWKQYRNTQWKAGR